MVDSVKIKGDIDGLISSLIEVGICDDQNFSSIRVNGKLVDVTFHGSEGVSIGMKDLEYEVVYREFIKNRSYSVKLIDGALIQMMYRINDCKLTQHRLAFYPSPSLRSFREDPDSYMRDDLFFEIVGRRIIPFPLRFDFDSGEGVCIDVKHPKCHLTLGDIEGCRIPVSAPLTPRWFVEFILRNFYNVDSYDFVSCLPEHKVKLSRSISDNELGLVHVIVPY